MYTSNKVYGNFYENKTISGPTPRGLYNLGNTCYINAALQVLFLCFSFPVLSFSYELKEVLSSLQKEGGLQNIRKLKRMLDHLVPMCQGYQQQDCYLFLLNFIDVLQTKFKLNCSNLSIRALNVLTCPANHRFSKQQRMINLTLSAGGDIESLVESSLKQQSLSFTCEKCRKDVSGTTKLQLLELPKFLLLKLNIFKNQQGYLERTHCETSIPSSLALKKQRFALIAIIEHFGELGRGHYTASLKKGADWFELSDEKVRPREQPKRSKNVYMLLYQK